jgi:hypothetical protein
MKGFALSKFKFLQCRIRTSEILNKLLLPIEVEKERRLLNCIESQEFITHQPL